MRFSLSSATDAAMTKPLALNARTMLLIANGFFSCAHHTSDSKDAYMGWRTKPNVCEDSREAQERGRHVLEV